MSETSSETISLFYFQILKKEGNDRNVKILISINKRNLTTLTLHCIVANFVMRYVQYDTGDRFYGASVISKIVSPKSSLS